MSLDQGIEECIAIARLDLRRFADDFACSIALFALLERGGQGPSAGVLGGPFIKYRIIAARDGALNIYHFACALESIRTNLALSKTALAAVDRVELREISRRFRQKFPKIDYVRHAIAHAGELSNHPAKLAKNAQKADHVGHGFSSSKGGVFIEALKDQTFSVGLDGDIFSVNLDATSLHALIEIQAEIDALFQGVDATP